MGTTTVSDLATAIGRAQGTGPTPRIHQQIRSAVNKGMTLRQLAATLNPCQPVSYANMIGSALDIRSDVPLYEMIDRSFDPGMGAVSTTTSAISQAIVRMEGANPAYAANNNPGNLHYAGQPGATPGAGGFARFATYQDGLDALQNQVALNINNYPGLTLDTFFAGQRDASGNVVPGGYPGYAPAADSNQPLTYSANVASWTGIPSDIPLSQVVSGGGGTIDTSQLDTGDGSTLVDTSDDTGTTPGFDLSSITDNSTALYAGIGVAALIALWVWAR